jgi:SAM-dependent methyltransferase
VTEYKYGDYWTRLGARYAHEDPLGAVCWDGAPGWFNRFFAGLQVRAVRDCLETEIGAGRHEGNALDLGCGTGRWTRWLDDWWTEPVGVDLSKGMLAAADPAHPYAQTDVTALPFRDATFDFALSVTVLLHLPHPAQRQAIHEVARILKPGGTFVLLEMVNRVAERGHVFPNRIPEWRAMLTDAGLEVSQARGEAYVPLLRAAFGAAGLLSRSRPGGTATDAMKASAGSHSSAIAGLPQPAMLIARAAIEVSRPVEWLAAAVLPASSALNVCILARKPV